MSEPVSDERLAQMIDLHSIRSDEPFYAVTADLLRELQSWRKLTELALESECVNIDYVAGLDEYQISIEDTSGRCFKGDSIPAAIEATRGEK